MKTDVLRARVNLVVDCNLTRIKPWIQPYTHSFGVPIFLSIHPYNLFWLPQSCEKLFKATEQKGEMDLPWTYSDETLARHSDLHISSSDAPTLWDEKEEFCLPVSSGKTVNCHCGHCVCGSVHMCAHMDRLCLHGYVPACRSQRSMSDVSLNHPPSYFLRQSLSMNVKHTDIAGVPALWTPRSLLILLP